MRIFIRHNLKICVVKSLCLCFEINNDVTSFKQFIASYENVLKMLFSGRKL